MTRAKPWVNGVVAAFFVASACAPRPDAPTTAPPSQPSPVGSVPAGTAPIASQAAHPQLGGTGWALTEIAGTPGSEPSWVSFLPGPHAEGRVKSDCSFIAFEYAYEPSGPAITFRVSDDGSYAEACSDGELADYARIRGLLPRVASWRLPRPDQLELVDSTGVALLTGGPLAPLPTPPPGGTCGSVPIALCTEAATQAFNFGLFPTPGQVVVSWRVQETTARFCGVAGSPRFDVIFELAKPTFEKVATVGELYGKLHACGDY